MKLQIFFQKTCSLKSAPHYILKRIRTYAKPSDVLFFNNLQLLTEPVFNEKHSFKFALKNFSFCMVFSCLNTQEHLDLHRKSARPAPCELPQGGNAARAAGCSGAMWACIFFSSTNFLREKHRNLSMSKPSIPPGTRDFSPEVMSKRKFILQTIETVYRRFGFMPLETPAMENMSTLTGKYGAEGDQLLFKILNSGDFLKDVSLNTQEAKSIAAVIADKGLRYDLTVPLARYVAMHRHEISFPFKRYQVQPVWRADRPQKGRYREFWQCDADVLGSDSLLCEADFIKIYQSVFKGLGLKDYEIRINHRKLLEAVAEKAGALSHFKTITVIIDKADKIGIEGVALELSKTGLSEQQSGIILSLLEKRPLNSNTLDAIEAEFAGIEQASKAVHDLRALLSYCGSDAGHIMLDGSLARGLDYYTGCIFEVVPTTVKMGSISGGGRYDDLTSVFGLKEKVSGIGISFGIDRIYDVMSELQLFSEQIEAFTDILFCPMDEAGILFCIPLADALRNTGIKTEIYPAAAKLKKQLDYANSKQIRWAAIVGENEMQTGQVTLKNLNSGEQICIAAGAIADHIREPKG